MWQEDDDCAGMRGCGRVETMNLEVGSGYAYWSTWFGRLRNRESGNYGLLSWREAMWDWCAAKYRDTKFFF